MAEKEKEIVESLRVELENSCCIEADISRAFGFRKPTLRRWIQGKSFPNKQNQEKVAAAMEYLRKNPRLQKHPSYGYATPEQIDRLQAIGIGPERDEIMKQIEFQNNSAGKVKR